MFDYPVTRTPKTEANYRKLANNLDRRFYRQTGLPIANNYRLFYTWFVSQKPNWAPATWRKNKAAMIWATKRYGHTRLHQYLANTDNRGTKPEPRRLPAAARLTSAKKIKRVPERDLEKIEKGFLAMRTSNYWTTHGMRMFILILSFGLRPCEFEHGVILKRKGASGNYEFFLRVRNAKHTNSRAHGEYRHLSLAGCPKQIVRLLLSQLRDSHSPKSAAGKDITHDQYIRACSKGFSSLTRALFPRRKKTISLYSARHQFSADLKKAGISPREQGALMGQANDLTSRIHYGKRRFGRRGGWKPRGDKAEIERVRCCAKQNPFAKLKANSNSNSNNSSKRRQRPTSSPAP